MIEDNLTNNWNYSFVISLKKRQDRRKKCIKEFSKITQNFEFFDAVAAEEIPNYIAQKVNPTYFHNRTNPSQLLLGLQAKYACLKSHYLCMKKALNFLEESNAQWVGIFQDDIVFAKNPNQLFSNINSIPSNSMIYLGGRQHFQGGYLPVQPEEKKNFAHFTRAHGLLHLSSAIYNIHSLKFLIQKFDNILSRSETHEDYLVPYADHVLLKLQLQSLQNKIPLQIYCTNPYFCHQSAGYSDILQKNINTRETIKCGKKTNAFPFEIAHPLQKKISAFLKDHGFKKNAYAREWLVKSMNNLCSIDSTHKQLREFEQLIDRQLIR